MKVFFPTLRRADRSDQAQCSAWVWTTLATVGLCVSGMTWFCHACSIVEVINYKECSLDIQLTTIKNGKPINGIKSSIYTEDLRPVQTLFTSHRGIAVPTKLQPGKYHIFATGSGDLYTETYLEVSKNRAARATPVALELTFPERRPIQNRLQEFKAVISDPAGSIVTGAKVSVYAKGPRNESRALNIKSDSAGKFDAHLTAGIYSAVFRVNGFQERIVTFEVIPTGDEKGLDVEMTIATRGT
jgi:hypothetical protein